MSSAPPPIYSVRVGRPVGHWGSSGCKRATLRTQPLSDDAMVLQAAGILTPDSCASPSAAAAATPAPPNRRFGSVAADVAEAVMAEREWSLERFMAALLPFAKQMSHPYVSQFYVGAVVRGGSGAFYLGANLEFPGSAANTFVHAEQFAACHAAQAGEERITHVAVNAAPCGHCRQFLSELNDADNLLVTFDPAMGWLGLAELLPHRFKPSDLGNDRPWLQPAPAHAVEASAEERARVVEALRQSGQAMQVADTPLAGRVTHMSSGAAETGNATTPLGAASQGDAAKLLVDVAVEATTYSYAPYSRSPCGVAVLTQDGHVFRGQYSENAACNPGLPAMQAALVGLVASGASMHNLSAVVLAQIAGAPLCHTATALAVLQATAPGCHLVALNLQDNGAPGE
eukprot:m.30759 g.30759  ORF g.30759 m.30759 type:complete len:400 (+) comp9544_c0_seq1:50-1249(+)